jgi:hypothetical protein
MLFSTELGEGLSPWTLTLVEPGVYNFYAYASGQLAGKTVDVNSVEEFELSAEAPGQVNQSSTFLVTASLKNLGSVAKATRVRVVFGNQTSEQQASLNAGQSGTYTFNLTAYDSGSARYTMAALSDSYTGYSGSIEVIPAPPKPSGVMDSIISVIQGFLKWLASLFGVK